MQIMLSLFAVIKFGGGYLCGFCEGRAKESRPDAKEPK